eukprot:4508552-Pyramimonas_sp.AAC.1
MSTVWSSAMYALSLSEERSDFSYVELIQHDRFSALVTAALYRSRMGAMFGKIAVEVPQYEVLLKKPLYEIRKYPPFVIVSTSAEDMVEGNNSFGKLAKYIGVFGSPENSKKEAISMTAPVVTGLESSLVTPCLQRHAVDTP